MCCYISKNKAHKSSIPLRINKLLKNQKFLPCVSSFLTLSRLPGTQFPVSMIHSAYGTNLYDYLQQATLQYRSCPLLVSVRLVEAENFYWRLWVWCSYPIRDRRKSFKQEMTAPLLNFLTDIHVYLNQILFKNVFIFYITKLYFDHIL